MENTIFKDVKDVIINELRIDEDLITMDATFVDDLSADSLDIVELIMSLEEKFNIKIPDSEAEKIVTVGDVVDYITSVKK